MTFIDEKILRAIHIAELLCAEREGIPLSEQENLELKEWKTSQLSATGEHYASASSLQHDLKQLDFFADSARIHSIIGITAEPAYNSDFSNAIIIRKKSNWWKYAAIFAAVTTAVVLYWLIPWKQSQQDDGLVKSAVMPAPAKSSATLSYSKTHSVYTLRTPRSGYSQMQLPDGTKVWLNADSYIRYPARFTNNIRNVEAAGELYFEVAANKDIPFVVTIGNSLKLTVLGTRFNIHAYDNAPDISATLLEGVVKLEPSVASTQAGETGNLTLAAGEMAIYIDDDKAAGMSLRKLPADTAAATAWRSGLFHFSARSFSASMDDISRWYNVEVIYENGVPDIRLWGEIDRQISFTQFLEFLRKAGVQYRLENQNRLIIRK